MMRALVAAFRGIARAPGRSLALFSLLCAAFLALTLIRSGYADMFDRIRTSMENADGDIRFAASEGAGMSMAEYRGLKEGLAAKGRFSAIRASIGIDGLVGNEEKSAPASGRAIEDSGLAFDSFESWAEVEMGEALARTLYAAPGDELSALFGGAGFNLRLARPVKTQAAMLDRFYIKMPLEILEAGESAIRIDEIGFWLSDPEDSAIDVIDDLSSLPELAGYAAAAYELGNTVANSIVDVYEESFRVVLVAVTIAMLLAIGNATLISSWERGSEWGTMLALGAPFTRVISVLVLEALILGAAASAAGSLVTLAVSALANLAGGIAFPPPPTQTEALIVRFKPEASSLALASGISIACAAIAAFVASLGARRRTVVELLYERN